VRPPGVVDNPFLRSGGALYAGTMLTTSSEQKLIIAMSKAQNIPSTFFMVVSFYFATGKCGPELTARYSKAKISIKGHFV
jgi:hypothetical protein